jgi:hypothetical protein
MIYTMPRIGSKDSLSWFVLGAMVFATGMVVIAIEKATAFIGKIKELT